MRKCDGCGNLKAKHVILVWAYRFDDRQIEYRNLCEQCVLKKTRRD